VVELNIELLHMSTVDILFLLILLSLLISGFLVVIAKHSIHSLLFLVLCFFFASILLFLLECELLALLFIIIYVGAIAVLFLFAVMMLESKSSNLSKGSISYIPSGVLFGVIFLLPLLYETSTAFGENDYHGSFHFNIYHNWLDLIDSVQDVEVYGQVLYTYFVLQFLIAGLILLLSLVGVVYLTNTFNEKQKMDQSIFKQVARGAKISSTNEFYER
jgi:NADH-quinone oxidoreductase subunit J